MDEKNEKAARHAETWAWWVTSAPELDNLAPIQLLLADQFTAKDGSKPDYTEVQKRHIGQHWSQRLKMVMLQLGFSRVAEEEYAAPSARAQPALRAFSKDVCADDVFERGQSIGLFDIPKETANAICVGITAATGALVDWHYVGGRVHMKSLAAPAPSASPALTKAIWQRICELPDRNSPEDEPEACICNFKEFSACVEGALEDSLAASPADQGEDARDAARYRWLRRGQTFSVVDCIGNDLRAEELDAAVDAAMSASKEGQSNDRG